MPAEECGICGATVALGDAAHVMLNSKSEDGVRDYYVCPTCFEDELLPYFPEPATEGKDPGSGSVEEADTDRSDPDTPADSTPDPGK